MQTKKVLLFGASGGMGRAIAEELAKRECSVVGVGHDDIDFDVPASVERGLAKLLKSGPFDWIIHAAGTINPEEPKHSLSSQDISHILRVNTEAVIYTSEQLLPSLNNGGGIIFISSTAGIWGNKDFPIYSASKGALNAYGAAVARRLEGSGRCSIVIAPGATNTPMRESIATDAASAQSPAVVAEVIVKIMSGASPYKNGDIITVRDGKDTVRSQL